MDQPTVNDMMEAYALDAVDHAKAALGIVLDFTPQSIENVEKVLQVLLCCPVINSSRLSWEKGLRKI
jgi:hypothetical protein